MDKAKVGGGEVLSARRHVIESIRIKCCMVL